MCGEGEWSVCLNMIRSGQMLVIAVDNSFIGHMKMDGRSYFSTKEG